MYPPQRINRDHLRAKSEITVQLMNAKRRLPMEQYANLLETVADYCQQELSEALEQDHPETPSEQPPW